MVAPMDLKDVMTLTLSTLGLIGGASAFGIGVWQYARAQRWKRAEFVAQAVKEFEGSHDIKSAIELLDWNIRHVELFEGRPRVRVSNEMVSRALSKTVDFTSEEAAIDKAFGEFFDGLERFAHFIESGLVTIHDLAPYLHYWIETIAGDPRHKIKKPDELISVLWSYVDSYGYTGVQALFDRFGYNIRPR
jgi:hypothetical protein